MGLSDTVPDENPLLHCAQRFEFTNKFLCDPSELTEEIIIEWQEYFFQFAEFMADLFRVDISTKFHLLMRHIGHHLLFLGCIRRGSSEENEIAYKEFKLLYKNTNNHVDTIASQLLTTWENQSVPLDQSSDRDPDGEEVDLLDSRSTEFSNIWSSVSENAIILVQQQSGHGHPSSVLYQIMSITSKKVPIWHHLKSVQFSKQAPNYSTIKHRTLFDGAFVYGQRNRHDGVIFNYYGATNICLIETVF